MKRQITTLLGCMLIVIATSCDNTRHTDTSDLDSKNKTELVEMPWEEFAIQMESDYQALQQYEVMLFRTPNLATQF